MNRRYATTPNTTTVYSPEAMNAMMSTNLLLFKSLANQHAIQFEVTIKTDGIRVNIIKKNKDKTVRKRSIECDDAELHLLQFKINAAVNELLQCSYLS